MLSDLTIKEFLEKTASGSPVPGGGSVAALSAALAASLTEMVAKLTIGKEGYETVEDEMKAVDREVREQVNAAAEFAQSDAEPEPRTVQRIVAVEDVCAWPNLTLLGDGTILAVFHNRPSHGRKRWQPYQDAYASSKSDRA